MSGASVRALLGMSTPECQWCAWHCTEHVVWCPDLGVFLCVAHEALVRAEKAHR